MSRADDPVKKLHPAAVGRKDCRVLCNQVLQQKQAGLEGDSP